SAVPHLPRRARTLTWSLLVLAAAGCGASDSDGPGALTTRPQALATLPTTCLDIRTAQPSAPDSDYTLYLAGDASANWTAYCHDMAGTPREYLTLVRTDAGSNFSQYTAGGASPGTDVRTSYTRLRIDPITLRVDTADQTFASSTGALTHSPDTVTAMPYGVAMACRASQGVGNIDLRGTPFTVEASAFGVGGADASGAAVSSEEGQVVTLSGGGACGWVGPQGSYNPYNQHGVPLQLGYRGGNRPASCQDVLTFSPGAPDGEYTLFVNKDPLKRWTAWCKDMAGTPKEYLPLAHTEEGTNYSQYTAGGNSPGTHVRTRYTRVRLNPVTLAVDTGDQSFAASTGLLMHVNKERVTAMTYAAAMGCSTTGLANVDLRGTPFSVPTGAIGRAGPSSGSSWWTFGANNQVVEMRGYGGCGWVGPLGSYNPFNQNGTLLPLAYTVPQP
ncbi:GON domain-containing protein, partial [Corallococcus carmarthensis]|uniref:GON domain-containing protein n=1 Tax=Corallococcus carmarthensis TaxID=2316728 RepID=UPI00148E3118